MVIQSEIATPGYFAQSGQWGFILMFAVFLAGAVGSMLNLIKK
jgi:hypothetical protein